MHWLSMSTWPLMCHGGGWQARSTSSPYPGIQVAGSNWLLIQLQSLPTCWQTWHPWFRTAVLLLSYSWPGSLNLAFLCVCPSEIGPIMPNGGMDTVFVCLLGFWPGLSSIRQLRIFSSGIRALHTDQGFLDPLVDRLWLQRVVHGIKCCQDPLPSTRLLIMDELMLVIWQCLDLSLPDHQLLWAACSLGYFGFLSTLEFTVPNLSSY